MSPPRRKRTAHRPTARTLWLVALGVPLGLAPVLLGPQFWVLCLALDSVLLAAVVADWVLAPNPRRVGLRLHMPPALYLENDASIEVDVSGVGLRQGLDVHLDLEGEVQVQKPRRVLREELQASDEPLPAGTQRLRFALHPLRRGTLSCTAVWLRWQGPMGLIERSVKHQTQGSAAIMPNIQAVRQAAMRLQSSREFIIGVKRQRFIGDGSEFESLREYEPGYDHRAIDWKASARRHKLLVREFEAERNHRIVLAFDTGYLMSQALGGIARLDHAIKAGLLLSLISLRMGDRVGLFAFDQELRLYVEPQPGMPTLQRLMQQTARLEYQPVETNFTRGLAELGSRLRRRAIVVLLTDFADTVSAESLVGNLGRLARRHLVIFVSVRDPELNQMVQREPATMPALHQSVLAEDLLRDREVVLQRLRRQGIFCIDAAPEEITVQLINRYLEVKRRGLA